MTDIALTISTDQIKGWGLVGCAIIAVACMLLARLVKTMVGRVAWIAIAIMLLGAMWMQRASIERSARACDPKALGIHLQISDPAARARCAATLSGRG